MSIFPAELVFKILYHSDPRDIVRWRAASLFSLAESRIPLTHLAHSPSLSGFEVVLRYHL